nr:putative reverse transcriptase, RNA-dependent DNA polymerase [Tanacetum cinerariifolium]
MPSCMENLRMKSIWTPSRICGKFESKKSVSFEEILIWTEAVSSSLVWQGKLVTCLIIYVDDMIITGNDDEEMTRKGMIDCKPIDTPMMVNQKLYMEEKAKLADKGRSCEPIHASTSNFPHEIRIENHQIPQRNFGHGVLFKANGHLETQVYTDADWTGDKGNRRLTSGYFTLVGGNLVTWKSKKQKVVALSSAETEFRGIA